MTLLAFAAVAFMILTTIMWAIEEHQRMKKAARQQLRRERGAK